MSSFQAINTQLSFARFAENKPPPAYNRLSLQERGADPPIRIIHPAPTPLQQKLRNLGCETVEPHRTPPRSITSPANPHKITPFVIL
jgi:hypothetical protein